MTWQGTGIDIHHIGGAFARVPQDATAFPNRSARYRLDIYGFWQDPTDDERLSAFARRLHAAMQPFAEQGEYVNFLGAEEASATPASRLGSRTGSRRTGGSWSSRTATTRGPAPRQPQHRPHRLSRLAGGHPPALGGPGRRAGDAGGQPWAPDARTPGRATARGRGWQRGQENDERFMNRSRRIGAPHLGQGRPAWP